MKRNHREKYLVGKLRELVLYISFGEINNNIAFIKCYIGEKTENLIILK